MSMRAGHIGADATWGIEMSMRVGCPDCARPWGGGGGAYSHLILPGPSFWVKKSLSLGGLFSSPKPEGHREYWCHVSGEPRLAASSGDCACRRSQVHPCPRLRARRPPRPNNQRQWARTSKSHAQYINGPQYGGAHARRARATSCAELPPATGNK